MQEVHSRLCSYCNQVKSWSWTGKKLKDGTKIYVDAESKARWAGKRCPDCEKKRVNAAVHCDTFERSLIFEKLKKSGYHISSGVLPLTVEKNGEKLEVAIRHAFTESGQVFLEKPRNQNEGADLHALVFYSVRIFENSQIRALESQAFTVDEKNNSVKLEDSKIQL